MSVVGNDFEKLKRFNLAELYSAHNKDRSNGTDALKTDAKPQSVKTDEEVKS